MPLHRLPFTIQDLLSIVTATLFFVQPGVDRKAVVRWVRDLYGSNEAFRRWGLFTCHKSFEWGLIIFYTLIYTLEMPIFERNRAFPHKNWPWKSQDPEAKKEYRALQWAALKYIAKFHLVVTIFTAFYHLPGDPYEWVDPEATPEWWVSAWQVLAGTLCAETGFYFGHRLIHTKQLYWCHKWHHEFKDVSVLATWYVHPLDALITDIIPAGLPVLIFRMHMYTTWMFSIPLILNAAWVHCGYELPLRFNPILFLPLSTQSEETHDLHHRNSAVNFGGAYFFWDRIMGTFKAPAPLAVLQEHEKDKDS